MAETMSDCLARAAMSRAAADAEPLENARQKHIVSAEVWKNLAQKARKLADGRSEKELAARHTGDLGLRHH